MLERIISRRNLLKSAALIPAALLLDGCSKESEYPPPQLVHKAGSVILQNSRGYGQASLIKMDGSYFFYTIEHVANLMRQDPSSATAILPGLGTGHVDTTRFSFEREKVNDRETAAFYEISKEASSALSSAIENGEFTYLRRASGKPNINAQVALPRPDTGMFTILNNQGYDSRSNTLVLTFVNRGVVCEGRSGSPALKIKGNLITNEIYGIVSSGIESVPLPNIPGGAGGNCSAVILARPSK